MVGTNTSDLLEGMIESRQLSAPDADLIRRHCERGDLRPAESEEEVLQWLAAQYDLRYSDLEGVNPDRQLLSHFPARVLLKHEMLPVTQDGETILVATSRLFATEGLDQLKNLTGLRLRPLLAPTKSIQRELKKHLGVGADTLDSLEEDNAFTVVDENRNEDVNLDDAAEDASIIKFVNQVLADAIALRATDIHLEPFEDELQIRYRVDGVLQDIPVPASLKRYQPAIVSRVKILSALDIAEKRLPQDGRIKIRIGQAEVDVRVSVIPMLHGEAVVLRLLRQDIKLYTLRDLDMAPREQAIFEKVLQIPHGIMLVTGPTGSGKTTSLYSALNEINDFDIKIITIEDPIEYQLRGVNQIQVNEKSGLTFAKGLRAILRHDPDVVLIGEIRDGETAQIAVQASLTGHLVFSTLHTNDAPGALTRLVDMGIEPYLVASSLEAVLAQRLVRVLCPKCKEVQKAPQALAFAAQIPALVGKTVYHQVGCEACRQTGYHGRHAVFEMMELNDELRQMMLTSHSSVELRRVAERYGMTSLSDDGWRLVAAGVTTVEEVLRNTKDQRLSAAVPLNGNGHGHHGAKLEKAG
jgi:general secretion pathway protein E/type IV pilus assembly protein PilB